MFTVRSYRWLFECQKGWSGLITQLWVDKRKLSSLIHHDNRQIKSRVCIFNPVDQKKMMFPCDLMMMWAQQHSYISCSFKPKRCDSQTHTTPHENMYHQSKHTGCQTVSPTKFWNWRSDTTLQVVFLSCNLLFAKYICKPLHRELSWSTLNIKETSFSAFSGNKGATCFYQLIAEEEDHTLGDKLTPSHQAVQKPEWVERIVEMLLVSFNFPPAGC